MTDAILAWIHFAAILSFSACLFAECFFYARVLPAAMLSRIARVDVAYGILTIAVVASGVAHAYYSPKGGAYYLHDWIFWTKMGLFLTVGLLSIAPTMHFIRLRRAATGDATTVPEATYRVMRTLIVAEVALLLLIPLAAAFMARGYGAF